MKLDKKNVAYFINMFSNKTKIPGNKVSVCISSCLFHLLLGIFFVGAFDIIADAQLVCPFRAYLISKGFAKTEVCVETRVKAKREREKKEALGRRKNKEKAIIEKKSG